MAIDRAFRRAILKTQEGESDAVVACLSGGRKTMSSSLQQAMSLLARPSDGAFHALLHLPYGLAERGVIHSKWGFPGDALHPRTAGIGLDGIVAPLVKLRGVAQRARLDLEDFSVVDVLQATIRDLAELVPDLETLQRHKVQHGERGRLGKLTATEALIPGAFIRTGEPVRRHEARRQGRAILERWSALGLYRTRVLQGGEEDLEATWDDLFRPGDKGEEFFASAKSKLHRKPREWFKAPDVASHFTPEARSRRAEAPRPMGFPDAVHENRSIRLPGD